MNPAIHRYLSFLQQGGAVVTATRRLRHALLEAYAEMQLERGHSAWSTPAVWVWEQWLEQCWREVSTGVSGRVAPPILLNDDQERLLWETTVQAAARRGRGLQFLQASSLAAAAMSAWRLLRHWNLEPADLSPSRDGTEDTRAFHAWLVAFLRRCSEQNCFGACELPVKIGDAAGACRESLRPPIKWLGFDVLTPAQQRLYRRLQDAGVTVTAENPVGTAGVARFRACRDPRREIESAARWARGLLERGTRGSVGVVFPDLGPVRGDVENIFRAVLHPERRFDDGAGPPKTFHLSLGRPLYRVPVIADAVLVLRFFTGPVPVDEISSLVRSPFIRGGVSEQTRRALFDARLRRWNVQQMGIGALRRALRRSGVECPLLAECLDRVAGFDGRSASRLSPGAWANLFSDALRAWGWPGDRAPDSNEQQAIRAWGETLARFSSLGFVASRLRLSEAVSIWVELLRRQVFQPLSSPSRIRVMGIGESRGQLFDHLWLAGMSDADWPPAPEPNPFLPYALQRRMGMPGAAAPAVVADSGAQARRLLGSAATVVVSYPQQRGEQTLQLSSHFRHLQPADDDWLNASAYAGHARQLCRQRPVLRRVLDTQAPPLAQGDHVGGGVDAIRDQAACPFRAFARHRLRSESLPEFEPGLRASQRGELTHQCLARIWSKLGAQSALLRLGPGGLSELIKTEVDAVLARIAGTQQSEFGRRIVLLEAQRLAALIGRWMRIERERSPFQVVAVEHEITWQVAGLKMSLRADRVDRCAAGANMVIDYKTGRDARIDDWFHHRPTDPQLPIYLLASPHRVDALAIARLRSADCSLQGLGAESLSPGVQPFAQSRYSDGHDWEGQRRRWRGVVDGLAAAFRAGRAEVDPRSPHDCRYCDVGALCRVFEDRASTPDDDADDPAGG